MTKLFTLIRSLTILPPTPFSSIRVCEYGPLVREGLLDGVAGDVEARRCDALEEVESEVSNSLLSKAPTSFLTSVVR